MDKKAILMVALVLGCMVFIGGCTEQSTITSGEEATETVTNISSDIEDVSGTLEDIDDLLGG